jgi:hypothetical protein
MTTKMERTCEIDVHECSSSDCTAYEPCGKPAVDGTPFCAEHQDVGIMGLYRRMRTLSKQGKQVIH